MPELWLDTLSANWIAAAASMALPPLRNISRGFGGERVRLRYHSPRKRARRDRQFRALVRPAGAAVQRSKQRRRSLRFHIGLPRSQQVFLKFHDRFLQSMTSRCRADPLLMAGSPSQTPDGKAACNLATAPP